MKLSFAITTHNEGHYVGELLNELTAFIQQYQNVGQHTYEIVIADDYSDDPLTVEILDSYETKYSDFIRGFEHPLNGDFAAHKNALNMRCEGDWILQLDADERVPTDLLTWLPDIIAANPKVEAYWLPRVNTVDGLTHDHVRKWGWILTTMEEFITVKNFQPDSAEYQLLKDYNFILSEENGYTRFYQPIVCWPDIQMRLYKNRPEIKWTRKVHEQLVGFEHFSQLPAQLDYAIRHHKEIERQERQNEFYDTLI